MNIDNEMFMHDVDYYSNVTGGGGGGNCPFYL